MKRHHTNCDYVNTHGKEPRGTGDWAFCVTVYAPARGYTELGIKFANGTFAAARKQVQDDAILEAKSIGGATEVHTETLG